MEHYSAVYRQQTICARNNKLLIIKRRVFLFAMAELIFTLMPIIKNSLVLSQNNPGYLN